MEAAAGSLSCEWKACGSAFVGLELERYLAVGIVRDSKAYLGEIRGRIYTSISHYPFFTSQSQTYTRSKTTIAQGRKPRCASKSSHIQLQQKNDQWNLSRRRACS